jgi:multicomponent Na+:H+ antiporter subunit C
MSAETLYGLAAALLAALGLYGFVVRPHLLHRIVAFNVFGASVFVVFGVAARRGAGGGFGADPIPQAMVITGIVVAFVSTALAVALVLRLHAATGRITLDDDRPADRDAAGGGA